ncbi:MAG: ankyrin repeat domain-containing protein [Planctomycetota bacterium]|nr:MAG: ankyrin repeat domain-containing protein [Planctomycetota bacterium]
MKLSLPLKLGIGVVLLFAAVIATCLLWTPVKTRYYVGKYYSKDPDECKIGVKGILSLGSIGREEMTKALDCELAHDRLQRTFCIIDVLVSDKKYGKEVLSKALRGEAEEADFLIKHWADFDKPWKDNPKNTYPLHIAAKRGFYDTARLLIDKGADVDSKDIGGHTPLFFGASYGKPDIVLLLIHRGANVNEKTDTGFTPLHYAANTGEIEAIRELLVAGIEVNAIAKAGIARNKHITPLDLATGKSHIEIINLLRSHGGKTGKEIREQENKGTREE